MTLLRLLLIFPAYFLGVYCAEFWDSKRVSYRYFHAINDVRQANLQLSYVEEKFGRSALSTSIIDQWLDSSLPANHRAWRLLVEHIDLDPWGNPYRCVENPSVDDEHLGAFGVYSTGRDGVSQSKGNDPDDLNSWDNETGEYYRAEIRSENRKQYAINGLFLTPFTYIAMLGIGSGIRRMFRFRTAKQQSGDHLSPTLNNAPH